MNNMLKKLLLIVVAVMTLVSLCSCEILESAGIDVESLLGGVVPGGTGDGDGNSDTANGDGNNNEGNNDEGPDMSLYEGKLLLVYNGKARFNVVYTADSGAAGKKAADNFVRDMRSYGVEIGDTVSDKREDDVTECEIIIGTGARNRGDECNISDKYLGVDGQFVKVIGNKIVIAGGTPESTAELFSRYIKNQMKITSKTQMITELAVDASYDHLKLTEYLVTSVKIGKNDIKDYTLIYDGEITNNIKTFRTSLYDCSGIWLETGNASSMASYDHCIIIRSTDDAGEDGFRAYVDGDDYIIECSYSNAFEKAYTEFTKDLIFGKRGKVTLPNEYTKCVSKVYYEDFGAVGNGISDDYKAMYNTHIYANQCGQTVCGKPGAKYTIACGSLEKTIPVKTNVDFGGATITIDDTTSAAYAHRNNKLFTATRDNSVVSLTGAQVYELAGEGYKITRETESFPWLDGVLVTDSMIRVLNSNHKDFIRHGSNQNDGSVRMDVFMVDVHGNFIRETDTDLDGNGVIGNVTTPVAYEFDNITDVLIYRTDDKPITIRNGTFYNICCRAVAETGFQLKYNAYYRGFELARTNVTVEDITHRMLEEPKMHTILNPDSHKTCDNYCQNYGSRQESYPYYGFFFIQYTANLKIQNCSLTGHTVYYQDKEGSASTGGADIAPVAAGSYDFVVERSCNVTFYNVDQYCETGLGDQRYWGIMSSNGSKNMTFEQCEINRFDAHQGFWNATLKDTTIGHSFNVVGGGTLNAINVIKITGEAFIALRGDYGATFRGDMNLINCDFKNYASYNTNRGGSNNTQVNTNAIIVNSGFARSNSGYRSPDALEEAWQTAYDKAIKEGKTVDAATKAADKAAAQGGYWLWDFGYECYLPINVVIDNFVSKGTKNIYLYPNLPNTVFHYTYGDTKVAHNQWVSNVYHITESVTIKNMAEGSIKPCSGTNSNYSDLRSIPFTYVKDDE